MGLEPTTSCVTGRRARPVALDEIPLQIRMVAGYRELVHRKEQLIAEA
jgi:hypothetical protein